MGISDRDYHRRQPTDGHGMMPRLTPVVKWLLILNIGIFLVDYLVLPGLLGVKVDQLRRPPMVTWGAFAIESALFEKRVWEFITFQFLHDSVGHILCNCLGLYFFGPWMERWWGSLKFLAFYLLCGVAGAAFLTLLVFLGVLHDGFQSAMVGASAGIYGILIGVAIIAPDLRVMLMIPPVELSIRQLALLFLAIAAGVILFNLDNAGGQAGHLGGAILGFVLIRQPWLLGGPRTLKVYRPPASRRKSEAKLKPRTRVPLDQDSEVDRILDKISSEGTQNLTPDERETLRNAAKRQHTDP